MKAPYYCWLVKQSNMIGRRIAVKRRHTLTVQVAGVLVCAIVVLIIENARTEGKHPIGELLFQPVIPFCVLSLKTHIDRHRLVTHHHSQRHHCSVVLNTRGTCKTRHYIRADAVEQVVTLELKRLASFLRNDEDIFAELLAQKTNKDILAEQKRAEGELQKSAVRIETVSRMYEKLYEDNATGKVTDEWFMQLSHKYEVERKELKSKIAALRDQLNGLSTMQQGKEQFIGAVRKFMEMEKLTAPLLRELIDHIDVYETEGTGKNRTQRIVIYYRFVGYIEIPDSAFSNNYTADTRQGVAVEYVPKAIPA